MRTILMPKGNARKWFSPRNAIGNAMLAMLRSMVSLAMIWVVVSRCQTEAMKASPHTFVVEQDAEEIVLKIKGDEYDHWITNQHDFTVVRDDEGNYRFATLSLDETALLPSDEMAGNASPKHTKKKDIRPHKTKTSKLHSHEASALSQPYTRRTQCDKSSCSTTSAATHLSKGNANTPYVPSPIDQTLSEDQPLSVSSSSNSNRTLKNLVVLIKFNDHENRNLPSRNDIETLMNSETADPKLAPTGSLKMLYRDHSYGRLTIESQVTNWILLDKTEEYYAAGQSGLVTLFHEALKYALDKLEADDFAFDNFDTDGDKYIDSIAFLTSSYGAEWGSEDSSGTPFEYRIWSHKWGISGGWKSARTDVRVTNYFVSPALWDTEGDEIGRIGVIAHEIGHYLDLPDLYDTDSTGYGLGNFCMMANSWGFDGSQLNPPAFSAWTKIQLDWTTPITPLAGVENRVSNSRGYPSIQALDEVYIIGNGEHNFPRGEYLLIEFRKSDGGMAIYHVDELQDDFNTEGYPNQLKNGIRWPYNGNHYKISLSPADEKFELEQRINQGNSEDLYGISQSLLPSKDATGPFPNTDSYQNGRVKRTGVRICVTSDTTGDFMTFLFADKNSNQQWIEQISEDFENGSDSAISFTSKAKIVKNDKCYGSKCAVIRRNKASMLVTVKTVCFTEVKISFECLAIGLKNNEKIILEYAIVNDDQSWTTLNTWTRGNNGEDKFQNKKWFLSSVSIALMDIEALSLEPSDIQLRFRSTTLKKKIFIDNLKIEGKF